MARCDETRDEQVSVCRLEEDRGYSACSEQKDQGYQSCSERKDQGYSSCTEQRDLGYSACQSWSPWFSWICLVSVWVSNIVCVAWTWIGNIVCVSWTWVSNIVCVAWTWISSKVCVLWAQVARLGCAVVAAFMGEATATVRTGEEGDPLADLPPFPRDFLWGAATSSYQVEGGITNNDWDYFTRNDAIVRRVHDLSGLPGKLGLPVKPVDLMPAGVAVHHADPEVLNADLDRLKLLGLNAYRFSVEWSRIQPDRPDLEHLEDAAFDQVALGYYDEAITQMVQRGIEPVLTLNHMSLPLWVCTPPGGKPFADENDPAFVGSLHGWEDPRTVDAYVRFVELVVERFKDRVRWWITLNEPVGSMIGVGYLGGVWPPGFALNDSSHAKRAYFNLLKAHVRAYDRIKALAGPQARIGIAHAIMHPKVTHTDPAETGAKTGAGIGAAVGAVVGGVLGFVIGGPAGALGGATVGAAGGAALGGGTGAIAGAAGNIHEAARNQFEYFNTDHFLDSLVKPQVDRALQRRPADQDPTDAREFYDLDREAAWTPRLDFIGVNYYRSVYVYYTQLVASLAPFLGGAFDNDLGASSEPHWLLNDMGWEICPAGLHSILTRLHERYRLPFLITENGIPQTRDRARAPHLVAHLQQLLRAVKDGVDVKGYCHWSLLDNWELHEHFNPYTRFGLFTVDRAADLQQGRYKGVTFPRHLTEGALALHHVVADGTITGAVDRFGTIAADGKATAVPVKSFGRVYEDSGNRFSVYLTRLDSGRLLGLLFAEEFDRWFPLEELQWNEPERTLTFRHPCPPPAPARVFRGVVAAGGRSIAGTFSQAGADDRGWNATRSPPVGLWFSEQRFETFLLRHLEGGYEGWFGKWLVPSPLQRWEPLDSVTWDGGVVEFGLSGGDSVAASIDGNRMTGTLAQRNWVTTNDVFESEIRELPWSATRASDGLPF
jgi:beta-glucosidase/6-phospho-beta-glucosidase/beta-galactosidase